MKELLGSFAAATLLEIMVLTVTNVSQSSGETWEVY
jgi:hypothetical protein